MSDAHDYDEDEVAKVRIHENDDQRRHFSIGSSLVDGEILYLRLPSEDVRRVQNWTNDHLDEVSVQREEAELLLEAADTVLENIGNGAEWGYTPEETDQNAEMLAEARDELRDELTEDSEEVGHA